LIVGSVNTNNLDFLDQRLIFKELKPIWLGFGFVKSLTWFENMFISRQSSILYGCIVPKVKNRIWYKSLWTTCYHHSGEALESRRAVLGMSGCIKSPKLDESFKYVYRFVSWDNFGFGI
jgi:hypothetical protein